jgi:hypothetical protein
MKEQIGCGYCKHEKFCGIRAKKAKAKESNHLLYLTCNNFKHFSK